MMNNNAVTGVRDLAIQARTAARYLRGASAGEKNKALQAISDSLRANVSQIESANKRDLERGTELSDALKDRLMLNEDRINAIADAVEELIGLADPVGEVDLGATLPNGLQVRRTRVPMGVVGMIYEARPNVTVDAACLALKSGNAVLLRGGSAAEDTNTVLVGLMRDAVASVGIPADAIASIDEYGREGATALMQARGYVDLLIPRGGAGLINAVVEKSTVPVIETGVGNCHVYIHSDADVDKAQSIVLNAKTHRVGVCNAAETLLLHESFTGIDGVLTALSQAGVTIHGCPRTVKRAEDLELGVVPATDEDWATEYLSMDMAVRIVSSLPEALDHIATYSSGHTEAIVTDSLDVRREFIAGVDSAAIMVNASTRFTDGGQLGLGAEIGISTQKLHARGPMGLTELTTTTWIVDGEGHIRD